MTSIARIWRAEGPLAMRDRVLDRVAYARWRAAGWLANSGPWPAASILNVVGVPIATHFGGVPLQLRARLTHEAAHRPIALLSRDLDGCLRLDTWDAGQHRTRMFAGTFPAALAGAEWTGDPLIEDPHWLETVRTCCQLVRARTVHIENVAGLSLASLARLADVDDGLSLALSVHDFGLFCRRPHLWESCGRFCDYSTDAARCHACLSAASDGFTIDQTAHRRLAATVLASAVPIVVPSAFMREQMLALFDRIDPRAVQIVPPGIDLVPGLTPSARHADRVAFIGGAQDHKGGARLRALAAALAARGVTVTIYGGYGHEHLLALRQIGGKRGRGVRVRGYFRAGSLPQLLARDGVAAALALSRVPESFSLVLSEAWAAGVPVVAPALGAFRERLAEGGGELVSADPCDAEILDALDRVRRERRHMPLPAVPTAAAAASAHLSIYRARRLITSS